MTVYKANFELKENTPVQYLGVYATRWQQEWGKPTLGFLEVEYTLEDAFGDLDNIQLSDLSVSARRKIENILRKLVT